MEERVDGLAEVADAAIDGWRREVDVDEDDVGDDELVDVADAVDDESSELGGFFNG